MNGYTNNERAEILIQALPYIKKYVGKIVVIKYGGNAMISEESKQQVMEDIALLSLIGVKVVLVHGGGPEINDLMKKMGKEAKFVNGLRVTDRETVDLVLMALAGKINKALVNLLNVKGGNAVGISGVDGRMIKAKFKNKDLGFVGEVVNVDVNPIMDLLDNGYTPVVSTVACDEEGNIFNINGDTAAAHIAGALNAKRLIMMTDINGVLKNKDDPTSLIRMMTIQEATQCYNDGTITGGMIPKVECCIEAIRSGVDKVTIIDGRVPHSIVMELLTEEGAGTMIIPRGDINDIQRDR